MAKKNNKRCSPLGCYIVQTGTTCSHSKRQRSRSAIYVVIATRTTNFTREIFFRQYLKKYSICHISVPDLFSLGISDGVFIIQNPVKSVAVGADFNIIPLRKPIYTLQEHLPRLNIFVWLLWYSIFLTAFVSGTNEGRFDNTSTSWKHLQWIHCILCLFANRAVICTVYDNADDYEIYTKVSDSSRIRIEEWRALPGFLSVEWEWLVVRMSCRKCEKYLHFILSFQWRWP